MARNSGLTVSSMLLWGGVAYLAYIVLKSRAAADTLNGGESSRSGGGSTALINSLLGTSKPTKTAAPTKTATTPRSPSSPSTSGGTVAGDGQTLSSQSRDVQKLFNDTYGANAATVWVQQHNAEIGA